MAEMLNQSCINTLTFQFIDSCWEVLRNPRKRRINIKSKDEKCFLWCHVRHINPLKEQPE